MAMRVPIYLVVKPTGQFGKDGVELTIVIDAKLTYASAAVVAARHEGAEVRKLIADKFAD